MKIYFYLFVLIHSLITLETASVPSLEPLRGVNTLLVKQTHDVIEALSGWESNNKYEIFNGQAQTIYYAVEETSTWKRIVMGKARPFTLKFLLPSGEHVMTLKSSTGFFTREVSVEIPPGTAVYQIKQGFAFFAPTFYVRKLDENLLFKIESPFKAYFGSFQDVNFDVKASDEKTVVGQITKQWSGFWKEAFTDADTFGIKFNDPNMDVNQKAAMLATLFLVDFAFYENNLSTNRQQQSSSSSRN